MGRIGLTIRINLSRRNVHSVRNTLSDLKKLCSDHFNDLRISIAPLIHYEGKPKENYLSFREFARYQVELMKYAVEVGIPLKTLGFAKTPELNVCGAVTQSSYVIDSHLHIHKCWNMVESSDGHISILDSRGIQVACNATLNQLAWDSYSPFRYDECRQCEVFPLCLGNCPWYRVVGKKQRVCPPIKYNIKDIILLRASLSEIISETKTQDDEYPHVNCTP